MTKKKWHQYKYSPYAKYGNPDGDAAIAWTEGWRAGYGVTAAQFVFNEWGNGVITRYGLTPREYFFRRYRRR